MKFFLMLSYVFIYFALFSSARGETLGELFASSKIFEEKETVKPKKIIKKVPKKRSISSVESPISTFVYASDYSFVDSHQKDQAERDIASVNMKGRIISVRRELGLTDAATKDISQEFVVNAGSRLGVSEGTQFKVYRNLPVTDPYTSNKQFELKIDFAVLKVIHVDDDVSIAKLVKLSSPKESPYVGLRGVLVGDYVAVR